MVLDLSAKRHPSFVKVRGEMLGNSVNRLQDDMSCNMRSISEYGFYHGADMRKSYEDVCSPSPLLEFLLIYPSDLDRAIGDIPRMGCKQ